MRRWRASVQCLAWTRVVAVVCSACRVGPPAPCRAGAIVVEWRWAQTCWCQAVLAVCSRAVVGRSCRRRNQNGVSRTKVCCLSEQSSGSALCTLFLPNTPSVSWSKHHFVSSSCCVKEKTVFSGS